MERPRPSARLVSPLPGFAARTIGGARTAVGDPALRRLAAGCRGTGATPSCRLPLDRGASGGPPPPPRRPRRPLGPPPRYAVIPRWGLQDRFEPAPPTQQAEPPKTSTRMGRGT